MGWEDMGDRGEWDGRSWGLEMEMELDGGSGVLGRLGHADLKHLCC
jgi:hypothetical protein